LYYIPKEKRELMMKKADVVNLKDHIIETANTIFSRFGFKKTTMNDIASAIHKAKSSIYYYFNSKEEIFKSIVEKESLQMKREINKAIERETTPEKKLRAYIITRIRILNKLTNYYNALKDEYLERHEFIRKIREEHLKEEINVVKKILTEGITKDQFEIKNPEITAMSIFLALRWLEYPIFIEGKSAEIEKSIDNLLDILFNGIKRR